MSIGLRTIVLSGAGLALVGALVVTAFRQEPLSVDLAEVSRGTLVITVNAEGKTRIRDIYDVSTPITGTLLRLPLQVGDAVVQDESIVAQVEPATAPLLDARSRAEAVAVLHEADASIRFAQAEITRTSADVAYAKSQFDRAQALVKTGSASVTSLEDATLKLALAEAGAVSAVASLSMAQASAERAEAALLDPQVSTVAGACCVQLLAPADGLILAQTNVSTRPVMAGEKLLSIGDPANLEIVVDLLSADATRLAVGASVELDRWGGDAPLAARLERLEPTARTVVSALGIEEQRVDAILNITSAREAWTGLGQGFSVFARIEEWREDDAILVPLSAVFQQNGSWFTFVARDGVATRREIEIGRRNGRFAVVESGLAEGDRVVTHPPDTISEGREIVERRVF